MSERNTYSEQDPSGPTPGLKSLDRFAGTWKQSSGMDGEITYEWMAGGFFLMQHVDLNDNNRIEIIGYHNWEGVESQDCISHYFNNMGSLFRHVYDMEQDTLTIWGGQRGSPAYSKGNTLTGSWVCPGGGYEATAQNVKKRK